jgi:RNA polymerase sigma-70 factor (ECF subfamily)
MSTFSGTLTWSAAPEARASGVSSPVTDRELIRRFLNTGDDEQFEILVQRHRARVFHLAASILGPGAESEAEDLTQDLFVLVYRKLAAFRGDCAFATWIYRLTRNLAIDRMRRAGFSGRRVDAEVLERLPDMGERSDPQRAVAAGQRQTWILRNVHGLGEPERSVVFLHYWMDRSTAEIAELLEMKPGTVKSHLHRARHKLARMLCEKTRDE